jgi:hypothetical protein
VRGSASLRKRPERYRAAALSLRVTNLDHGYNAFQLQAPQNRN